MSYFSTRTRVLPALVLSVLASSAAYGQTTTTGAITGTVEDPSGATTSNASVTIHNVDTNAEKTLQTDGKGFFIATQLEPGTYTVTITEAGFADYSATHILVQVGQTTTIQPQLAVASAGTQTVSVSAAAALINTESPDFATVMDLQALRNLPINGRRWSDLALLTPGVVADSSGFGLLSVRGISPLLNNVTIDGADDNQAYFSEERGRTREGYSTPQAAIREFQVNTGVYSTEYGRALGAAINSVTKSGSNTLHGDLYFYDRDNEWGAHAPFNKLAEAGPNNSTVLVPSKPTDWRKQWGFGAGGPLIKDKLFWFYTYDGYRHNFPGTAIPSSPGAFFQAPDAGAPAGGVTCAAIVGTAGKTSSTNTVDNQVCALQARLGLATYQNAVDLYNTDMAALRTNLGTVLRTGDQTINMPKLDWQINSRNRASILYNRLRWDSPGGVQTNSSAAYSLDSFGNDFVKLDYILARLDTLVTNNIANELRYQYGRELNDETPQKLTPYDAQFVNGSSFLGQPPQISLQSSNGFTDGIPYYSFRQAYPDERKWQVADTANWTRGQHTMKFGGDIVHNYDLVNSLGLASQSPNGEYSYTNIGNFFADLAKPTGSCGASATEYNVGTLPCYTSFGQNFGQASFDLATTDLGFFFQDNWKILRNLTVDLGIRYDYQIIPDPYKNLLQPSGSFVALPQSSQKPDDRNNIGPRVGFAWDTFGTGKTVLRGGAGLFYGRIINATILGAYSSTGSPLGQIGVGSIRNSTGPQFPSIFAPTFSPSTSGAPSVQYFDKHFQNPQALEYDLTLQQQFGNDTVFSLSYLATQSRELPDFIDTNLLNTAAPNNNTAAGRGYTTVNYVINPATQGGTCGPLACGSTYSAKVYNSYANPAFQHITDIVSNINASYNALVAEITNHAFRYADFDASYTWSHSLDFNQNQSTQASTNVPLDPNANIRSQYGNSSFNVPNRFVAHAFFKYPDHFKGVMHTALDGWRINPLVQLQSGLPYTLVTSSFPSGTSVSSGWNGAGGSPAYVPNIGINSFKLRREEVFDLRGEKDFSFHEKYNLQLMAECFNVFNHQNYTAANSTGYLFGTSTAATTRAGYTGPQTYTTQLNYNATFGNYTNSNSNYAYSPRQVQLAAHLIF